jgi:hypothetical protein
MTNRHRDLATCRIAEVSRNRDIDMLTIAPVAQKKSGTGKTTLALSLAVAAGRRTLIVDLDPQASACKWGDRRNQDAPAIIDAQPSHERSRPGGLSPFDWRWIGRAEDRAGREGGGRG